MQAKHGTTRTSEIVMTAMMMCLIMVAIFLLRVPVPFTQGYVNLSDGIIFIAVFVTGRKSGTLAAALGSMLGDVIGGFAMWAPWSFFIKGGMALITALIYGAFERKELSGGMELLARCISMAAGGIFMVFGYFVGEGVMYGNWVIAALGVPWNIGQFIAGIILAVCVMTALKKAGVLNRRGRI